MKIFIDSANIAEIKKWMERGIADGVTTNPSIMLKDGIPDIKKGAVEIAKLINPKPLSVEVTSNDVKEMVEQGTEFAAWAPNIVIKIPVINEQGESCLEVIKKLSDKKIRINATCLLSISQLVLVTKAGAAYASIFAGRVSDEGGDASYIIRESKKWLDTWKYSTEIIVGSVRTTYNVQEAIVSGAHIITIPPSIISKMLDHKYTRDTVKQFIGDAQKSLSMMKTKSAGK